MAHNEARAVMTEGGKTVTRRTIIPKVLKGMMIQEASTVMMIQEAGMTMVIQEATLLIVIQEAATVMMMQKAVTVMRMITMILHPVQTSKNLGRSIWIYGETRIQTGRNVLRR